MTCSFCDSERENSQRTSRNPASITSLVANPRFRRNGVENWESVQTDLQDVGDFKYLEF